MDDGFVLQAEKLCAGYRGKPLIRDLNLALGPGQILSLIGPNGAGKSTLLKTVAGQLPAISGSVRVMGRELARWPRLELARRLAVVLTERVRPERMTCLEVAAMGRYPYTGRFGALSDGDRRIVRESLLRVGAEPFWDRDFMEISDGQKQRVLLARALSQQPDILVLDEPASYLDIRHKIELMDILTEEARKKGTVILMALHEISLAEAVSDRILCVGAEGAVRMGAPKDILTDEGIAKLFGFDPAGRPAQRFFRAARAGGA